MRGTLQVHVLNIFQKESKKGNPYRMASLFVNGYVNNIMIDEKCPSDKIVIGKEQTVEIEIAFFKGVPNIKIVSA